MPSQGDYILMKPLNKNGDIDKDSEEGKEEILDVEDEREKIPPSETTEIEVTEMLAIRTGSISHTSAAYGALSHRRRCHHVLIAFSKAVMEGIGRRVPAHRDSSRFDSIIQHQRSP